MKVLEMTPMKSWYVVTDEDYPNCYRRSGDTNYWEYQIGNSWEELWDSDEQEKAYKAYWSAYSDSWGQSAAKGDNQNGL